MTKRTTLPKQRADETRRLIIRSAEKVFGREGYGEASVDDILEEAGISRGAFYHHFANKQEVFRGLLNDHIKDELDELDLAAPGVSLPELVKRFVGFQVGHLASEHQSGALSLEFWAYAGREEWAREAVASFHLRIRQGIAKALRSGQESGAVRPDVDVEGSAILLLAIFEGIAVLKALDPSGIRLEKLAKPWVGIIERFVGGDGPGRGDDEWDA